MAKNVDLSSQEWCDIVFEGKNKDFGAYQMRRTSTQRHNKAVIYTLIGAIIVAALAFAGMKYSTYLEQQRLAALQAEQEQVMVEMPEEEQEPEPENERLEQPKPEVLPEEVLKSVKVTELAIVEDEKVKKEDEIKTQDELKQETTAFGQKDNDQGTEDRNVTRTLKEEVVVEEKPVEKPKEKPKEEIFKSVEQMPQFPGGDAALMKWLSSHINYPAMAAENNVQGKVIVQFVVDKAGKVSQAKVARSSGDKSLDNEALRVCRSLPNFTPGRQNGQAVSVWYTLPVTFKLEGAN